MCVEVATLVTNPVKALLHWSRPLWSKWLLVTNLLIRSWLWSH